MDFWQGITIVTVVHVLAALSPGPDIALMTRQSLIHGRTAGVLTSLGISLGLSLHIIYSIAGLAAIIAHSVQWMFLLKVAGGGYLLYLGFNGLRSKPATEAGTFSSDVNERPSPYRLLVTGLLCNTLNPKAVVYFLSLFTVVLSPEMPLPTLVIYGIWIMVLQMACFTVLACLFTHSIVHRRFVRLGHWIDRAFGTAMITLGLRVLTSDN